MKLHGHCNLALFYCLDLSHLFNCSGTLNEHIFTFHNTTRCSGVCLPYCCAGSRPISDSDISDYDVDDGIGVVPPGAWVNSMVLLSSFLLDFLFHSSCLLFVFVFTFSL